MAISRLMLRRKRRKRKAPVSGLEKKIHAWLEEAGIPFQSQYPISRIHVDLFVEPNLVIEASGCYWHFCEKCRPEKTKQNRTVVAKDKKRYTFLLNQGYRLLVIWEHEVENEGKDFVIDRIRKALQP